MPNSWRTDTFMSGRPGTPAWAWAGISFGFRMFCRCSATGAHRIGYSLELGWQASDQSSLLEIVISLDDFAQLVLGPFVPPIGVGVVAFDQLLEPRLDLVAACAGAQIEGFEGFQLQGLQRAPLLAAIGSGRSPREKPVWVR